MAVRMLSLLVLLTVFSIYNCEVLSGSNAKDYSDLYTKYGDIKQNPLIHGTDDLEFLRLKERVKIVHEMLRAECPGSQTELIKKRTLSGVSKSKEQVETILFERMIRMLLECRQRNAAATKTSLSTTMAIQPTTVLTTTPTPPAPSTNRSGQPVECQTAIELVEPWRQDHNGSKIRPTADGDYQCDPREMTDNGRPWFRFSGTAGNMMLDNCPATESCGTTGGIWTGAAMPSKVAQASNITAQASVRGYCYYYHFTVSVIRCSYDVSNDFVYRMVKDFRGCSYAFCGMTKLN